MTIHRIPRKSVASPREVVIAAAPAPANEVPKPRRPSLLDPAFVYVPASQTDIRRTFERVRREMGKL